jgi:endonuclease I
MKLPNYLLAAACVFCFLRPLSINGQTVIHSENFNTGTSTWTAVDVQGPTFKWTFNLFYAKMNGFISGGTEISEDWLVSPNINMDNSTGEIFNFKYKNRFPGPNIQLYYTTNYTSSVTSTTWTELPLSSIVANNTNTVSAAFTPYQVTGQSNTGIDVSGISGPNVRFAFKYTGIATVTKEWLIDDIEIAGTTACTTPTTQATTLGTTPGSTTATLTWNKGDGSNSLVIINYNNSFTNPVNGTTYTADPAYNDLGEQIVYVGTAASVSLTSLVPQTQYFVRIYNFQTCVSPITYVLTTPLSGSFTTTAQSNTTCAAPTEPASYYSAVGSLTCAPMLSALRTIITNGFIGQSYSGLWTDYECTDKRPDNGKVYDIYSDIPGGTPPYYLTFVTSQDHGTGGTAEGQFFNREHSFPKSWFGGSTATNSPGTDLFHVYPTDKKVNGIRGNQPYGETSSPTFTSQAGNKYGPAGGNNGLSVDIFEPINAYKGDLARTYFYMATRYNIGGWANTTAESRTVLTATNFTGFLTPHLAMLYRWHLADPVSQKEIDRNNTVYAIQGNRNPYIDHPEWVARVFISSCGVIPIELVSFDGKNKGGQNFLNWKTASEKNTEYFAIERLQNSEWIEIGRVKAVGFTQQPQSYNFTDATPQPISLYRLRTMDFDGTVTYSKTITLSDLSKSLTFKMFPNPAKEVVHYEMTSNEGKSFALTVTDIVGRVWIQKNLGSIKGGFQDDLDVSALPFGVYYLNLNNGLNQTNNRFIKQ